MRLQQLLGIELPIIQAPMAGVQKSALTIAVSNAGGLGSLPCALLSAEEISRELHTIRDQSARPFSVNFFCHEPPMPDESKASAWLSQFSAYYAELGIPQPATPSAPTRMPINKEMAELICEFEPSVVSFHFGLPSQEIMDIVHRCGAKIISSATTVEEALWLESHGADAIIAQGVEAGGHRGMFLSEDISTQVGTFALVPQVVQAVKVPVIAAGGIADARGVKAAMTLGASGVQVGTAYLLCPEAATSAVHRAALKGEWSEVTALTNIYSGRPARAMFNRMMKELGPINPLAPTFPLASIASAPLRAKAESIGSDAFSPLWAGQNTSGCKEVSAATLTRELAELL